MPKAEAGDLGNQEPGEGWGEKNGVGGVGGVPRWVLYRGVSEGAVSRKRNGQ